MTYAASSTLVTTGMLPVVVLASAALTAPVSLFLLWRYRRAVLGAMAKVAGSGVGARDVRTLLKVLLAERGKHA